VERSLHSIQSTRCCPRPFDTSGPIDATVLGSLSVHCLDRRDGPRVPIDRLPRSTRRSSGPYRYVRPTDASGLPDLRSRRPDRRIGTKRRARAEGATRKGAHLRRFAHERPMRRARHTRPSPPHAEANGHEHATNTWTSTHTLERTRARARRTPTRRGHEPVKRERQPGRCALVSRPRVGVRSPGRAAGSGSFAFQRERPRSRPPRRCKPP
jgi:hypothetical protein